MPVIIIPSISTSSSMSREMLNVLWIITGVSLGIMLIGFAVVAKLDRLSQKELEKNKEKYCKPLPLYFREKTVFEEREELVKLFVIVPSTVTFVLSFIMSVILECIR